MPRRKATTRKLTTTTLAEHAKQFAELPLTHKRTEKEIVNYTRVLPGVTLITRAQVNKHRSENRQP